MARISGVDIPKQKEALLHLPIFMVSVEAVLKRYWQLPKSVKTSKFRIGQMKKLGESVRLLEVLKLKVNCDLNYN